MKKFLLLLLIFLCGPVHAGTVSTYFEYQPNSTVTSTNLNGNFDNIRNVINGGLDDDNVATGFRLIEILSSNPAAGNQGRVVFNTTSNTLNFDTGVSFLATALLANTQTFTGTNTFSGSTVFSGNSTFAGTTIADLGSVTTADINGGTMDNVQVDGATATGMLFVNDSSDDLSQLGSQGTTGQLFQSNGSGANPDFVSVDDVTIENTGSSVRVKDSGISQAKLKTTTGEVSTSSGTLADLTLPGGEYGFYPQIKGTGSPAGDIQANITSAGITSSSYITNIALRVITGGSPTAFAQQRYITSSGIDYWVILLVNKSTGEVLSGYAAPDHPIYGNGGDINDVPHPFPGANLTTHEIVILDKNDVKKLKDKAKLNRKDSILTQVYRDYKVDVSKELPYKPLHTGAFIEKNPVLIDNLPNGQKVRPLTLK